MILFAANQAWEGLGILLLMILAVVMLVDLFKIHSARCINYPPDREFRNDGSPNPNYCPWHVKPPPPPAPPRPTREPINS